MQRSYVCCEVSQQRFMYANQLYLSSSYAYSPVPNCFAPAAVLQMLQSELKSCQQKQQQQQAAYESTIAVLQSDMEALRSRLSDTQDNTRAAVEQLQTSFRLQLDKQRQELEEQFQVGLDQLSAAWCRHI